MARNLRVCPGGCIYHVLNRGNARMQVFAKQWDYEAFEQVIEDGCRRFKMRLLAYCIMPNHWHMVLWPETDGDLATFMRWVTMTHAQRWLAFREAAGTGHLYQGRYRSFLVKEDRHFLTVCRYVERNPVRARLVARAQDWKWGSLWRFTRGKEMPGLQLDWPVQRPANWEALVNADLASNELETMRSSVKRGSPYGDEGWQELMANSLGLRSTIRPRGRPCKV